MILGAEIPEDLKDKLPKDIKPLNLSDAPDEVLIGIFKEILSMMANKNEMMPIEIISQSFVDLLKVSEKVGENQSGQTLMQFINEEFIKEAGYQITTYDGIKKEEKVQKDPMYI